jgi:rubrerythrin
MDSHEHGRGESDGYVSFWSSGASAKGEFHCSDCGYGVIVAKELPQCPMCGSETWEEAAWSPFRRADLVA